MLFLHMSYKSLKIPVSQSMEGKDNIKCAWWYEVPG
jgi:hypothetical protein